MLGVEDLHHAVVGLPDVGGHGVAALDRDRLLPKPHVAPAAVVAVLVRVLRVELELHVVVDVERSGGGPPGDGAVGAEEDVRHGEGGIPGDVEAGAVQADAEDIGRIEVAELRSVHENGAAVGGLLRPEDPEVAGAGPVVLAAVDRQRREPREARGIDRRRRLRLFEVLLAFGHGRRRQRVLDPEDLVEDLPSLRLAMLADQRIERLGIVELVRVVREPARHGADVDHRDVELGPRGRLEAELGELARQEPTLVGHHLRHPLVVARRVAAQDVAVLRRKRLDLGADLRRVEVGAGLGVVGDMLGAEHLGNRPEHRAAGHLHLEQAVLRHGIAEAGVEPVDVVGIDLRDAPFVAQDRHVGRSTRGERGKAEEKGRQRATQRPGRRGHQFSSRSVVMGQAAARRVSPRRPQAARSWRPSSARRTAPPARHPAW